MKRVLPNPQTTELHMDAFCTAYYYLAVTTRSPMEEPLILHQCGFIILVHWQPTFYRVAQLALMPKH
jgi:hypothetical protein